MSKKLHVNCYLLADHEAEALRQLVREYNEPSSYEEYQADNYEDREPIVEILYEESSKGKTGFDLWFVSPAVAFYFGAAWGQRLVALAQAPAEPPYPRFLYSARLGYFCRQNAPGHFCLVSKTQLQVRREREQHLFDPGDWQASDEALFLAAFKNTCYELRMCATKSATYQRRGAPGNEWFYCNALAASKSLPQHVRLNLSQDDYGRSWNLLWAHDTNRNDQRRVASTEQEFEQQFAAMLADAEAMATGKQEGGPADG